MAFLKNIPFRSEKWLAAVRSLEYCVKCGRYGVQAAHLNQGKGMGSKVSDCLAAALCPECHREIDQGATMSREERRSLLAWLVLKTIEALAKAGKIIVA